MQLKIQHIRFALNSLRYLSSKKIINFSRIYLSYLFSTGNSSFSKRNRPFFISVEPSDTCQLQCPECPVGQRHKSIKEGTLLDENNFKKIIDELKSDLFHVIFYFQGEPLINKRLTDFVSYAHQQKIFTSTSTNAQLLNSDRAKSIVESGLDKLIISMDGTTQETYETYRIGGKLEKAIDGVKNIVKWKERLKSLTPIVEIQFIVMRSNEHQIKEMRALAKELGANRIAFKTAQLYDFENGHPLLTSIEKYARYKKGKDGKFHIKSMLPNRCLRLWSGSVFTAKGEMLPCCFDKDASFSFGNINNDDSKTIWHNEKASGFRKSILTNRKQYEICRNCTSK